MSLLKGSNIIIDLKLDTNKNEQGLKRTKKGSVSTSAYVPRKVEFSAT